MGQKLPLDFFRRDVLEVAPDLLGKYLVRKMDNGDIIRLMITDVEAYRGEEDKACHASRGKTPRTETLYLEGGHIYVYLIYGLHWLLNIVTGDKEQPQGVMIRAVEGIYGPGRVGRYLQLDISLRGQLITGEHLWIEDSDIHRSYKTAPRVGIDYAEEWKDKPWRFIMADSPLST